MLLIHCPWCGPRDETEFRCGGEAHIARPADPDALTDARMGRLPLHAQEPARACISSDGCTRRLPALVQRRARHGDARDLAVYKIGDRSPN